MVGGIRQIDAPSVTLDFGKLQNFLDEDSTLLVQAFYKDASGSVLAYDKVRIKVTDPLVRMTEDALLEEESQFGWFDLLGRPVSEPLPNRVYIDRNGRKIMILD